MISFILVLCVVVQEGNCLFSNIGNVFRDIRNPMNDDTDKEYLVIFQNKCIEHLGCFYTGPPFYHPLHRPLSFSPITELKTRFILFTPSNSTEEQLLEPDLESIKSSSLDPRLPIKVLIHGFRSDLEESDIRFQIKDALLSDSDYNVIVVDWTEHNGPPYAQAVANARVVGAQVAFLLNLIIENMDFPPEEIHVIGHSLGGQMAGWVGERITNLGRITGLDPAGPYFQSAENEVRLDVTDALFVDIIHSDGGENIVNGLGIGDPVGHMDFYPNGGKGQPGCVIASQRESFVRSIVDVTSKWLLNSCDHGRANEYFLESIKNQTCRFLAIKCDSYESFEEGDCSLQNSTTVEMGFRAQKIRGLPVKSKFFLRTNSSSPFCLEEEIDFN